MGGPGPAGSRYAESTGFLINTGQTGLLGGHKKTITMVMVFIFSCGS